MPQVKTQTEIEKDKRDRKRQATKNNGNCCLESWVLSQQST